VVPLVGMVPLLQPPPLPAIQIETASKTKEAAYGVSTLCTNTQVPQYRQARPSSITGRGEDRLVVRTTAVIAAVIADGTGGYWKDQGIDASVSASILTNTDMMKSLETLSLQDALMQHCQQYRHLMKGAATCLMLRFRLDGSAMEAYNGGDGCLITIGLDGRAHTHFGHLAHPGLFPPQPVRPTQYGLHIPDLPEHGHYFSTVLSSVKQVIAMSDGGSDNLTQREVEDCVKYWQQRHADDQQWLPRALMERAVYNGRRTMKAQQRYQQWKRVSHMDQLQHPLAATDWNLLRLYKGADDISVAVTFC